MLGISRTRIAVFEQMPLFRAGIIQVLNAENDMAVVAEGQTFTQLPNIGAVVDVIVVDAAPLEARKTTFAVLNAMCGQAKIVLMTFTADEEGMRAAFAAGVRGYVLKGGGKQELLDAVRAAQRDEDYASPALAAIILRKRDGNVPGTEGKSPANLSHREAQIFELLSAGLQNKEIGTRLSLSEKSVKRYVTCIFEKLNVRNRVEAAMLSRSRQPTAAPSAALRTQSLGEFQRGTLDAFFGAETDETSLLAPHSGCFFAVFGRHRASTEKSCKQPAVTGTHIVFRQD